MKQNTQRWWDWTAGLLLFTVLWAAALRLEVTDWTKDLNRVITIALIAIVLGFFLGQSRFSRRFAVFYSLILTIVVIPWQLGMTMDSKIPWLERLSSLGGRIATTLDQLARNIPLEDSILFIVAMMVLYWLAGLTTGFHLTRSGKPWFGLAVTCITVLVIELYDPARATRGVISSIIAILVILIISRLYYLNMHRRWETNGIPVDTETGYDWMRAALVAGLILVIIAWNIPSWLRTFSPNTPERREAIQSWLVLREKLANLVAPLSGSVPTEGDYYQDDLPLGTSISTSDDIVFIVTATQEHEAGVRYYWRARTYDKYLNGEWFSTYTHREEITAVEEELPIPEWEERFEASFTFALHTPLLRNFFSPGVPVSISRPAQAVGSLVSEDYLDASTLLAVPPLRKGEVYRVTSSISSPTQNSLAESQAEYPEWVEKTYLQLPSNFPSEIRTLAEEITAGLETPYEKAEAITSYLRKNIQYVSSLESAPSNVDPMEYMLFDTKKGFCYYYASAEILMLRSIGIPARLAVGFAEGEMDDRRTTFTVRRKDAHAWPEVYFTEYGWIEFEPTVVQSALVRRKVRPNSVASDAGVPGGMEALSDSGGEDARGEERAEELLNPEEPTPEAPQPEQNNLFWIPIAVAVLLLGLGSFFWFRFRNGKMIVPSLAVVIDANFNKRGFSSPSWIRESARLSRLTPLERAFNAVPKALQLLGKPADRSLTPAEQVDQLLHTLPGVEVPAQALLQELHRGVYSPVPADLEMARKSSRQITRLAWRFWIGRILNKVFMQENSSGT